MSTQLQLEHIRGVLVRLEETIIFGLIERAQFRLNPIIYVKNGLGEALGGESLVGFLLHECERSHAKVRRYTSPEEHPFYNDLPAPILPPLKYDNPLHPNTININPRIRAAYEQEIVPLICEPGDDSQYGSSAVNDVALLQSLSKRIHYGKFVAESKYRQAPHVFGPQIKAGDEKALWEAITVREVEEQLFERVRRKAMRYGEELIAAGETTVAPEMVVLIYQKWIVPLSKQVEVLYLLQRLS
ncbi:MAG: chorismate mutase [Kiritimatiellia bacterium]